MEAHQAYYTLSIFYKLNLQPCNKGKAEKQMALNFFNFHWKETMAFATVLNFMLLGTFPAI